MTTNPSFIDAVQENDFDFSATYLYRNQAGNIIELSGLDALQIFQGRPL